MATLRITAAEFARDFDRFLKQAKGGDEVIIESDSQPLAVLRPPDRARRRLLSESLAIALKLEEERGGPAVPDDEFAKDMAEIIAERQNWKLRSWD